ncbi:MAG: PIN domain-containing protein [Cyanobacteria bacterium]|jgi:predicted nucleic acid-binding protein|nr:PIN domain-containing protein [Cyanobacteria bacterium GSL.Bin1]
MRQVGIVDTGFLVAFLNSTEQYHSWVKKQLNNIPSPLITCEPVITETCFLLSTINKGEEIVFKLLSQEKIKISFRLDQELESVRQLMEKYCSVPMSLADACLVRMSEIYSNSVVFTLDSDFRIYRKNKKQMINLIIPDDV